MRTVVATVASLAFAVLLVAQDGPQVMGYETYTVVAPVTNEAEALSFAERHCAKYNRFAHFRRMDGLRAVFDCDAQSSRPKPLKPTTGGVY